MRMKQKQHTGERGGGGGAGLTEIATSAVLDLNISGPYAFVPKPIEAGGAVYLLPCK